MLLAVLQMKERIGGISRIAPDGFSAVCRGLFKKESDISFFEGAHVTTGRGEPGVIQVRLHAYACVSLTAQGCVQATNNPDRHACVPRNRLSSLRGSNIYECMSV
jgi:hypothetical protein